MTISEFTEICINTLFLISRVLGVPLKVALKEPLRVPLREPVDAPTLFLRASVGLLVLTLFVPLKIGVHSPKSRYLGFDRG